MRRYSIWVQGNIGKGSRDVGGAIGGGPEPAVVQYMQRNLLMIKQELREHGWRRDRDMGGERGPLTVRGLNTHEKQRRQCRRR